MKKFEVGDEVLVKAVVKRAEPDDEGDVLLMFLYSGAETTHEYIGFAEIVQNNGQPNPEEPMGLGAVVDVMSTDVPEDNGKWVRADIYPMHPWTLVGADEPVSCTWERLSTGRRVTVLSEGLIL